MIPVGMFQPNELKSEDWLPWSQGRGVDVWAMFVASLTGDLEGMKKLVARDRGLLNCSYEYISPIRLAVREDQAAVVDYLLAEGVNPISLIGEPLLQLARDREYWELAERLEDFLEERYHIRPDGDVIAEAIRVRDLSWVRMQVGEQPELVSAADARGNQPIHWAVLTRQIDIIDYLLSRGADIEAARPDGARPMDLTNGDYHFRSWYRDLPPTGLRKHEVLVGYLMGRGAVCDISVASKIGYYERVLELLDARPELANTLPDYITYYSGLPLRNAAAAGQMEIVKLLLDRGALVDGPEPGIAPMGGALHSAIGSRHWEIVRLLLERGADANAAVESSGDCLHMARVAGAPEEIVELIASRATRRAPDIVAYENEEWDRGRFLSAQQAWELLEQGLDPQERSWLGITRLHRAVEKGEMEIAEVCLEFGADINAIESQWGSTPLGWAARMGKTAMVQFLLSRGADRDAAIAAWARPIEWARKRGHAEIAELFK